MNFCHACRSGVGINLSISFYDGIWTTRKILNENSIKGERKLKY